MPREALLFVLALFSVAFANSYAFMLGDVFLETDTSNYTFETGVFSLDEGFFEPSDIKRYVVFGNGTPDKIPSNILYGVQTGGGFLYVVTMPKSAVPELLSRGHHIIEDFELDFYLKEIPDASRLSYLTGADTAATKYNLNGTGITVGIVDTGVDFSNPDIKHSLARDESNHPLMLDADGQGIVITNSTFFAFVDNNGIIRNYSKPVPEGFTSSVYTNRDGIFLDLSRGGNGTNIPIYNSFFPHVGDAPTFNGTLSHDMKIGNNGRDYIVSKSGAYHLGVIYQGALQGEYSRVQVVPVLVVDQNVSGIYDTIIPDMSTSWHDYTRFDLEAGQKPDYDFDFTDEKPIILGSGNEFLIYDSDGDGRTDYSAGTVGARVLDVYGVMTNGTTNVDDTLRAVNGTLLAPLDKDGNFFGVMTDFINHGTSSAATIASVGLETYDIYNNTEKYVLRGVAPGAKILPIKALWFGDTVYSWLWAAGFDSHKNSWNFTGKPRVDIISNSWGISDFPSFGSAPGMDLLSLIASALSVPSLLDEDFGGVTVVSSAGNSGHGYGTIGIPAASPFSITVGATTNNVFVGYGPFEGQPRFGNSTTHHGHLVDFTSRGPSIVGDVKPDLMSTGAYSFVPSNTLRTEKESVREPFSMYGGTSMSAPLVAGNAAILMEGLHHTQRNYDAFTIKNILMSTATDLHNDPFTQGSGMSNIKAALDYIYGNDGVFLVYNDISYSNVVEVLDPVLHAANFTGTGLELSGFPSKSIPMTGWFAGQLRPGDRTTAEFTIENPSELPLEVSIMPQSLSLMEQQTLEGTTKLQQRDPIFNENGTYAPNYIRLSDVREHDTLGEFFGLGDPVPPESSLLVLNVNFPFDDFMNKTDDTFANDIKISSLYLYDWIDGNNDTRVDSSELSMVSRAGSWGTVQELRASDPTKLFDGVPLVGIYPVPQRYSYWIGDTQMNSTSMNYTLSASYYQRDEWPILWSEQESIMIPPYSVASVDVSLVVPEDLPTGVYQGFLTFEGKRHTVNAPVSFVVATQVDGAGLVKVSGLNSNDILFENGRIRGAFDMSDRFMAGDWRQYYFDVIDGTIDSAAIELSWQDSDTNLAVFVMDPAGRIVQTNMPSGIFGHFLGWPSLDWLGPSPFSQGGGFFPVKNKNDTSTVLLVPINQTGTYSILTHSTLFGGNSITEPISLTARFAISSDVSKDKSDSPIAIDIISQDTDGINSEELELMTPESTAANPTEPRVDEVTSLSDVGTTSDSSFIYGILLGVVVGVVVGLSVFVLRKTSNTKRLQDAPPVNSQLDIRSEYSRSAI